MEKRIALSKKTEKRLPKSKIRSKKRQLKIIDLYYPFDSPL